MFGPTLSYRQLTPGVPLAPRAAASTIGSSVLRRRTKLRRGAEGNSGSRGMVESPTNVTSLVKSFSPSFLFVIYQTRDCPLLLFDILSLFPTRTQINRPNTNIMAPTIHFVRHAQGWHNVNVENEIMPDPELTPTGEQQCVDLRAAFPHHDKLKALVASPMTRTLNTAILSFGRNDLYPITAIDNLQELSDLPSDTGSSPAQLRERFGAKVDVTQVREEWTQKMDGQLFEPTLEKIVERAKASRRAIREIASKLGDDDHLAVVAHGGFLHWLTDEWQDIPMPYRKS